jgi:hypothetical protein
LIDAMGESLGNRDSPLFLGGFYGIGS